MCSSKLQWLDDLLVVYMNFPMEWLSDTTVRSKVIRLFGWL